MTIPMFDDCGAVGTVADQAGRFVWCVCGELLEVNVLVPLDEKSDLSLVYFKNGYPHCRIHGAMSCNHIDDHYKYYRCYSAYASTRREDKQKKATDFSRFIDRSCEAACKIPKGVKGNAKMLKQ